MPRLTWSQALALLGDDKKDSELASGTISDSPEMSSIRVGQVRERRNKWIDDKLAWVKQWQRNS